MPLLLLLPLVLVLVPTLLPLLVNIAPTKTTGPSYAPNLGTRSSIFRAILRGSCEVVAAAPFSLLSHVLPCSRRLSLETPRLNSVVLRNDSSVRLLRRSGLNRKKAGPVDWSG